LFLVIFLTILLIYWPRTSFLVPGVNIILSGETALYFGQPWEQTHVF